MSRPRGPFCSQCGHEYRSKDGALEVAAFGGDFATRPAGSPICCTYCGVWSPPIAEKPFHELSKSAIEKYMLCPARWGFVYLHHKREPSSKYSKFGIIGHEMGERWLKFGELPRVNSLDPKSVETKAATSLLGGIPHMPPPTLPGLRAEIEFHFLFEGVRYMGYKDAWAPLAIDTTLAGDWKFCGDVNGQHNLTNDTIRDDIQTIIYGFDDVRRGAGKVWFNWVYMPRGERGAKPVRACMTADEITARMRVVNETGKKILALLNNPPDVRTLEAVGGNACRAYGMTCPHLVYCHVSTTQRLTSMEDLTMAQLPPGMFAPQNGAPSPLDALVGMTAAPPPGFLGAPPAPAFVAPPAPAPVAVAPAAVNPPPAPQFDPSKTYRIMYQGTPYDVDGGRVPAALAAGAQLLAEPAPVPVAPAPTAPPLASTTGPAPGVVPGRAPGKGRGRPRNAAPATPGVAPAVGGDFDGLLASIRDALDVYLG